MQLDSAAFGETTGGVVWSRRQEGRETWLRLNAIEDVAALVRRRVVFIVERQQVNDSRSPYDGAFVCYDNEVARAPRLQKSQRFLYLRHRVTFLRGDGQDAMFGSVV